MGRKKLATKLPTEVGLAFSGGGDSLAALHYLLAGRRKVHVLFQAQCVHEGKISDSIKNYISNLQSEGFDVEFYYSSCVGETPPKNESLESFWRNRRYDWFDDILCQESRRVRWPVVTAHTITDAVETYLMWAINGRAKLIPPITEWGRSLVLIRPFLFMERKDIRYAGRRIEEITNPMDYDLPQMDPDNFNPDKGDRAYLRKHIVPHVETLNPGIHKTIIKAYEKRGSKFSRHE